MATKLEGVRPLIFFCGFPRVWAHSNFFFLNARIRVRIRIWIWPGPANLSNRRQQFWCKTKFHLNSIFFFKWNFFWWSHLYTRSILTDWKLCNYISFLLIINFSWSHCIALSIVHFLLDSADVSRTHLVFLSVSLSVRYK